MTEKLSKGIGAEFMEETKYRYMQKTDQQKGLPQPPLELDYDKSKKVIDLPTPDFIKVKAVDLRKAIENRRSVRNYLEQPLALEELSFLLWCTQGVKEVLDPDEYLRSAGALLRRAHINAEQGEKMLAPLRGVSVTKRTVPSGGSCHAFETYLLVNRVQGLHPGLYRFLAIKHKLVEVSLDPSLANKVGTHLERSRFPGQHENESAVTLIWIAVPYRMVWRYGERSYRGLLIEAGHICQNLYLAAQAIDSGVCAMLGFKDDVVNGLLGLDGKEQFVIYAAAVGKSMRVGKSWKELR